MPLRHVAEMRGLVRFQGPACTLIADSSGGTKRSQSRVPILLDNGKGEPGIRKNSLTRWDRCIDSNTLSLISRSI
jgi:hypothetical protein